MNHKKRILILSICDGFGGMAVNNIGQYQALKSRGHDVTMLIPEKSKIRAKLDAYGLTYCTTRVLPLFKLKPAGHIALFWFLYKLVKQKNIQIIHSNLSRELWASKMVARVLPVKVVHTRHTPVSSCRRYRGLDGVIGVSKVISEPLRACGVKQVAMILPFFDEAKFLNFGHDDVTRAVASMSRRDFFKHFYHIEIQDIPIICTIACFNSAKNQALLLRALHELIYIKKRFAQVVFVGQGKRQAMLEQLVKDLGLAGYVYFVGFTDNTPAVLYHVDMHVLPSKREPLGIVTLEAMLMGKPAVGATGTGAQTIIHDGQTGLLFECDSIDALANKIAYLLDNPEYACQLGAQGQTYAIQHFLKDSKVLALEQFYDRI